MSARERAAPNERFEAELAALLQLPPTYPKTGPDILEEHADVLVRGAIQLRELAALWREERTT